MTPGALMTVSSFVHSFSLSFATFVFRLFKSFNNETHSECTPILIFSLLTIGQTLFNFLY